MQFARRRKVRCEWSERSGRLQGGFGAILESIWRRQMVSGCGLPGNKPPLLSGRSVHPQSIDFDEGADRANQTISASNNAHVGTSRPANSRHEIGEWNVRYPRQSNFLHSIASINQGNMCFSDKVPILLMHTSSFEGLGGFGTLMPLHELGPKSRKLDEDVLHFNKGHLQQRRG